MSVLIFEEHSSSLAHWWKEGTHRRTVVYLDAHLDLQFISTDRMRRLEGCTSADGIEALRKPHHLCPDRGYSYSLENFLYPASRMGLIDRLVWVAPPHVPTEYSHHNFDRLCQMDGIQFEELRRFKKGVGGWIEGRMLGLDVVICDYRQLEQIPLPSDSLIDIDIDYFVELPGDAVWVDPMVVFTVLRQLLPVPPFVSISRSVESGFTPLRYRFLADYLAALWEGRELDSEHYNRLYRLDRRLRAGECEAVLADCRCERQNHPDCAATCYLLSLAEQDRGQAATWRSMAASLSAAYRPNLLRSVCEIRSRRLAASLGEVAALHKQAAQAPLDPEARGMAEVEIGLLYTALGQLKGAVDCYRRATGLLGEHSELALEIAKLLVASGQEMPAIAFLQTALEDDKSMTAAHVLLAQIDMTRGMFEQSRQHLEKASETAPAWRQLMDLLAFVHRRLGNSERARELREKSDQLQRQSERLARQLR